MCGSPRDHRIKPLVSHWSQAGTPTSLDESIFRGGRRAITALVLPAISLLIVEV